MPKMTHPDSKQTIEVDPKRVDLYRTAGWQKKAEPKPASKS